ncbi:MAG: GlsB/YeaQ/YmgE family stress response membrane protein [Saprospiraceae bacterium]|nr:GlsB/YeaQ/YmgE family stress response membrane protein [Saprospiraceae bacterium]
MELSTILVILAVGAASGWLAGFIRQGYGFGLLGNIVIGILGGFIGNWLFEQLNIRVGSGIVSHIVTAVVGALVLLFLIGLVQKGGRRR